MPDTKDKIARQDAAMQRIAAALGVEVRDIRGDAPGDPALGRALSLEQIAEHIERALGIESTVPDVLTNEQGETMPVVDRMPVTVETVEEKPLETVETVEVVDETKADGSQSQVV